MNKIYYVNHVYQYYQNPDEPTKKFLDKKPIGFFYSKDKALELIDAYSKLPGFKDSPEGFYIDEYVIDSTCNKHISKLIEMTREPVNLPEILYSICYIWENEDTDEDRIEILGFFSTESNAKNALNVLLKIPELRKIGDYLEICEEHLSRKEWAEGFIKWAPTSKERIEWGLD